MSYSRQIIHCPNCGSLAQREICTGHHTGETVVRTQCRTCDYLLVTSSDWVKVIESYAPGRRSNTSRVNSSSSTHPSSSLEATVSLVAH